MESVIDLIKLAICKEICKTAVFTWIFTAFLNVAYVHFSSFFFLKKKNSWNTCCTHGVLELLLVMALVIS